MEYKFSIVIPAYNAQNTLAKCLTSIIEMDYPSSDYEIIVVDDGSSDRTPDIARDFSAKVVSRKSASVAAVRNLGASMASGEILAFLDSDMVVDKDWLKTAHDYYFVNNFNGLLFFADRAPDDANWIGKVWYGSIRTSSEKIRKTDWLPTRDLFIPKALHDSMGGYDEALADGNKAGEDKEYTYRMFLAGRELISDGSLDIIHLGCERNLKEFIRKEWWRQGNSLFIAQKFNFRFRLLRHVLLSLYHFLLLLAVVVCLLSGFPGYAAAYFLILILPTALMTLNKMNLSTNWSYIPHVWFVNFLRWNVSGFAVLPQIWELARGHVQK